MLVLEKGESTVEVKIDAPLLLQLSLQIFYDRLLLEYQTFQLVDERFLCPVPFPKHRTFILPRPLLLNLLKEGTVLTVVRRQYPVPVALRSVINVYLFVIPFFDCPEWSLLIFRCEVLQNVPNSEKQIGYSGRGYYTLFPFVLGVLLRQQQYEFIQYKFQCRQ